MDSTDISDLSWKALDGSSYDSPFDLIDPSFDMHNPNGPQPFSLGPQSVLSERSSSSLAPEPSNTSCEKKERRIKAHRKTRDGCFGCKRRRVKCSEERPSCKACVRNRLRCIYPFARETSESVTCELRTPQVQQVAETYSGALEYTALDMRLLHVFILDAYPHLPMDCGHVWRRDVPQWAHTVSADSLQTLSLDCFMALAGKKSMISRFYL